MRKSIILNECFDSLGHYKTPLSELRSDKGKYPKTHLKAGYGHIIPYPARKRKDWYKVMHFFKKLSYKATPAELSEVHARLDAEMCGLTQEWVLESLGTEKLLPLITIADNEKLGATKAILYAYGFGYLAGKEMHQ